MALEAGFNKHVWSDESAQPYHSPFVQGATLGMAAALGATALYGVTRQQDDGTRLIDNIASYSRTAGNLSPFQILNTFRIPEWVSPLTSPSYQNFRTDPDLPAFTIDKSHLNSTATFNYLKQLTGLDFNELKARGITPDMKSGADKEVASHLLFERSAQSNISGKLYSVVGDTRHLLSDNTMLMQLTGEAPSIVDLQLKSTPINRAARSVFSAMDMWGSGGWDNRDENKLFTSTVDGKTSRAKFAPIPGLSADWKGTSYIRGFNAFGMERFNQLLSNVGTEVFGSGFTKASAKIFGSGLDVRSGPGMHMQMRFGAKMAGLVGAGLAISELDWLRRQTGIVGNTAVSGVTSFGVGALAARAGFGAKASFFAGLASFSGQMILPGFDQGILPGIASTYAVGTEVRASGINPLNYYRRTLEGYFPGVSSFGVGVLAGGTALAASYARVPGSGKPLPQVLIDKYTGSRFGLANQTRSGIKVEMSKGVRDIFWDEMITYSRTKVGGSAVDRISKEWEANQKWSTKGMRSRLTAHLTGEIGPTELSRQMNALWSVAEQRYSDLAPQNTVNKALTERLQTIASSYNNKTDLLSKIAMQLEGGGEQIRHAFFGASLAEETTAKAIKELGFKSPLGRAGLVFGAGFTLHGLATGGFLGSMQTREELKNIYSGKQLVEVGKGRFWEAGGTPWEGGDPGALRPHWYPIMMSRARQAGIWGWQGEEDRRSPLTKFLVSNFTYNLERETYYDRPYPITAPAFANLPIIGGVLAATIGQVFKPAKTMHSGEWITSTNGNLQFADVYEGWKREPDYDSGAAEPGIPRSPFDAKATFGDMNYQYRELAGLTGFLANTLQDTLTGESLMYGDRPRLADSGMMTSHRRHFWDMSLGGGGPLGEVVRRVLPSFPKEIQRQNPIINSMPVWMPSNLKFGDPMSKIPYGEAVLPGPGYAALHPELKEIDPEDYPLIYRYDILSQVSPRSKELRSVRDQLYQERAQGYLTPAQEAWVDRIDTVVQKQWNRKEFERIDKNAIQLPGSSITQASLFQVEKMLRKGVAPFEYLAFPGIRPTQKFLGDRDAIEQYEYERLYGSPVGFWNKPFRDWLRPSMYSLANYMGWEGKPAWRVEADAVNEEFDKIEFYKWMKLSEQARAAGNIREAIQYEYQAGNTRMGVNPMGNPLSIYWSLPEDDRAFFNAFAFAEGKDRHRILEMVPADQTHLYETLWSRLDNDDPRLWSGNVTSPDSNYLYQQYHQMNKGNVPPVDWVGYQLGTDIRDIKVRYVNELGRDMRDFGLWDQELKKAYSQPHLANSTGVISSPMNIYTGSIASDISQILDENVPSQINVFGSNHSIGSTYLEYNDNRADEINRSVQDYINVF